MNPLKLHTRQLAQDEPLFTPRVVEEREDEANQVECAQLVKKGFLIQAEGQIPSQSMGSDLVDQTNQKGDAWRAQIFQLMSR